MKGVKKKKEIRKGDCFERAYIMLICGSFNDQRPEKYFGEPMLVHGIVWHDNTGKHIHGWVEDNVFCYDFINGVLKAIPKQRYYELGHIEDRPRYLFRYTKEIAKELSLATNQYYFSNLACKR